MKSPSNVWNVRHMGKRTRRNWHSRHSTNLKKLQNVRNVTMKKGHRQYMWKNSHSQRVYGRCRRLSLRFYSQKTNQ